MKSTPRRILVAEDNQVEAMKLEVQLRQWGYQPLDPAPTANDAIRIAQKEGPHLILMDIKFTRGVGSGIDAAREIRRNGGQMPIIFVTAHADEYLAEASEIGFFGFLDKPLDDRILKEVVRTALEHYQFQQDLLAAERESCVTRLAIALVHTLKNSLAPLALISRQLLDKLAKGDAEATSLFEDVQRRLDEGKTLLTQLCLLAGDKEQESDFDSDELLKRLAEFARHVLRHNIALSVKGSTSSGLIHGRRTSLEVGLMDLIFNANNAMPEGGRLDLDAETCELDALQAKAVHPSMEPGRYVRFRVRDTGKGIPLENLASLYDRDTRASTGTGTGSGLGLWLLKEIVTANRGYLPLPETEAGSGTEFSVYFPALSRVEGGAGAAVFSRPAPDFRGNGQLILFVEDDAVTRELAVAHLQSNNYQVIAAAEARQAVALAEMHRERIVAVISDVHLPSGMEPAWLEILRRTLPLAKIIVCSGTSDPAETAHVHDEFLPKPYTPGALLAVLHTQLGTA